MVEKRIELKDNSTGKVIEGIPVKVTKVEDPSVNITLEDGTEMSLILTVTRVIRKIGKWAPNGDPEYSLEFKLSNTTYCPENLKRPENAS